MVAGAVPEVKYPQGRQLHGTVLKGEKNKQKANVTFLRTPQILQTCKWKFLTCMLLTYNSEKLVWFFIILAICFGTTQWKPAYLVYSPSHN